MSENDVSFLTILDRLGPFWDRFEPFSNLLELKKVGKWPKLVPKGAKRSKIIKQETSFSDIFLTC